MVPRVVLVFLLYTVELSLQGDTCAECNTAGSGLTDQCRNNIPNSNFSLCSELDQIVSELEGVFRSTGLSIPPEFFQSGGFLRVLAFVETRDESNWPRSCCEDGGIWNVQISDLDECQQLDHIQDIVPPYWFIRSREDLDCPINSAFGAVLLMLCNIIHTNNYRSVATAAADLPTERDSFPSFYARYYCHPNCSESEAVKKFNDNMQEYLNTSCVSVESCSEAFDIIVLLDSSGSIGDAQFADARTAVADLSSKYTIGSNYTRFGVILYSHTVHSTRDEDVIALDEYTDSANLTAAILSLPYHRGGTLTGSAITFASEHGFNAMFGARERGTVPRILMVATDGRSFDDVQIPSQSAADDGIILFSIGIGDGPDQNQLLNITGGVSSRVFNTEDYRHLIGLSPLLAAETCKAQVSVPLGTQQAEYSLVAGTVKYFQITIPENCSQSLMLSFARDNSSGSVVVYASFTIPNPNKRLHDYNWTITAEPVNATIPSKECTRRRRQAPLPEFEQPRQFFFSLKLESSSHDTAEFMLNTNVIDTPEESQLSLTVTELPHSQGTLMYSCTATCSCPSATIAWEKGLSLPTAAQVTVSEDGQQTNITIDTTIAGYNGHYTCIIQSPGVISTVQEVVTVDLTCKNNGTNINPFVCDCPAEWSGLACDRPVCSPVCANGGTCVSPQQCSCVVGWTGSNCDTAICNPSCENGGTCVAPNNCACPSGWTGDSCSQVVCSPPCQNGGSCVSPDHCVCTHGWTGADCSEAICNFTCQNGGHCSAPDRCNCTTGWEGQDCSSVLCSPPCQNGGTCLFYPNTCRCMEGWRGTFCEEAICSVECANNGICMSPDTCNCTDQWQGEDCTIPVCNLPCRHGGHCSAPDKCNCITGWEGQDCSSAICRSGCANNGVCVSPDNCTCTDQWQGRDCTIPVCSPECLNGGTCDQPNRCQCPPGWSGNTCNKPVCTPPCVSGSTCTAPGKCHCKQGRNGTSCETAPGPVAAPIGPPLIAAIAVVPTLLLLLVALSVAIACIVVRYRRRGRRDVTQEERAPSRKTSVIQEVGQTIKKKLSVISGNFAYTETVPGSESMENLHKITEEDGGEVEEEVDRVTVV